MKRVWWLGTAGLLGLLLLAGSSFGDDQPAPTKKTGRQKHTAQKPVAPDGADAATSAGKDKQAPKSHLPAGFGKVNLTAEQHQKATAVMDKYSAEIKQLETQIHDLKAKRDGELNALLSDTQKKSLAEVKSASQKARAQKASAKVPRFNMQFSEAQRQKLRGQQEKEKELQQGKRPSKSAASDKSKDANVQSQSKDQSSQDKSQDKK